MAIASVGTLGSNNNKAASDNVTLALGGAVPVGDLVVVWLAQDAHGPSGGSTSGDTTPRYACKDSKGNIYTQLGGHEDSTTTRPGFALFVTKLTVALANADVITCTYQNAVPVAKGITAWQFTCPNGWACPDNGQVRVTTTSGDPAAVSLSGMDSQEYLFLHILGAKGPDTDAYTWDSDYTQVGTGGTTGGTDASNCTVTGGFRISTLTGDTVDVTSDTADRQYLQGLYALCEVTIPTFPTTPILDDFNRADENPLDNGTWDASACISLTPANGKLVSNRAAGAGGSWWGTDLLAGDNEVYASQPVKPTVTSGGCCLMLNASNCAQDSTRSGYGLEWTQANPTPALDSIEYGQLGNSSGISGGIDLRAFAPVTAGGKIGLCKIDKTMHLFADFNGGAGWQWVGAIYWKTFSSNSGKIGLGMRDGTTRLDDFGGGTHVSFLPQIFRRLPVRRSSP